MHGTTRPSATAEDWSRKLKKPLSTAGDSDSYKISVVFMNPLGSHLSDREGKTISGVLREERVGWRWDGGKEEGGQGRKILSRYLPLPPRSHSSSYLQWSQSWPNFRCWPRSPTCAWWARSDHTLNWNAGPCRPETVRVTTHSSHNI